MTIDPCTEMRLLMQADIDGELGPADSARVAAHIDGCAACETLHSQLFGLSCRIRREARYHEAPEAVRRSIAALAPAPRRRLRLGQVAPFGAGLALAASVALAVLPTGGPSLPDQIAADHVRALQPGHLIDVVSTDRHTVKPWFAGKLDFSPKVVDLSEQGFPLQGGRLDFVAGRPVAVLVYKRREHIIDVYVWPASHRATTPDTDRNGFNLVHWQEDQLGFWAVSDLDARELAAFTALFRNAH